MSSARVLIIGGGAAGLTAAIAAARCGAAVTLLEADAKVGRSILASGNGRCNLSNLSMSPESFNNPVFVAPVLDLYDCEAIRSFFGGMGLLTRADDEGRVYPVTNFAGSVLDVLRLECAHLGVEVRCSQEAEQISHRMPSGGFEVRAADGVNVPADAVVVASGGGSSLLTGMGHSMVKPVPVLGPIKTDTRSIRGLSGIRVRCAARLLIDVDKQNPDGRVVASERGELLFRDYGVSGIVIFDLSRYLQPGSVLSIDLLPDIGLPDLEINIARRCDVMGRRTAETFFAGMLHDRLARAVLRAAGVSIDAPVATLPQSRLASLIKDFRLPVAGRGDANQAQVTRGGVPVDEFDPRTMASTRVGGMFAAGEVLDIDGRSGGYNLHWAWASGIVAGEAAARMAAASPSCAEDREGST